MIYFKKCCQYCFKMILSVFFLKNEPTLKKQIIIFSKKIGPIFFKIVEPIFLWKR
jgi:hypothetical protein